MKKIQALLVVASFSLLAGGITLAVVYSRSKIVTPPTSANELATVSDNMNLNQSRAGSGTIGGTLPDSTNKNQAVSPEPKNSDPVPATQPANQATNSPLINTPVVKTPPPAIVSVDLTDPHKKDIAMQLVSSAENSSLNWKAQYGYIEDIQDGRGYTAGIIGFCTGTDDLLEVVQYYTRLAPNNILAKYLPALKKVNGTNSHNGLDPTFTTDWKTAAADPKFQKAQNYERDTVYFNPTVSRAKADGLHALGQFIYYDAIVTHGPGNDPVSFGGLRAAVIKQTKPPSQGGDEIAYLNAFLDVRTVLMKSEPAHADTTRIDTEQRLFLKAGNLDLNPPLNWQTYGDRYTISQ